MDFRSCFVWVLSLAAVAAPGCIAPEPPRAIADAGSGASRAAPRVETPRGALPPKQAERVIARLDQRAQRELLSRHAAAVDAIADAPLRTGNAARILVDGPATHEAMIAAMEGARDHINLGTYIFDADEAGAKFADVLIRKRQQGLRVNVMYDSIGSSSTPAEFFAALRTAGIAVCEFGPVNPLRALGRWSLNNRNHRKILVVDGRIGFTGGINISGVYSSGSSSRRQEKSPREEGWRDTQIEVRGPVAADLQRLFLDPWREQCGAPPPGDYYPSVQGAGDKVMRVVAGRPGDNEVYASLLSAVARAELRAWITVGYFVPDPRLLEVLIAAARRGVDVRLVLPGVSDFWAPLYAGRSHYDALLAGGVRIYERHDALMHAKSVVVDGVWSTIGSTNLDWRSFVHNYEANVDVLGADFGAEMERLFGQDVAAAVEVTADRWARRGQVERMKEWIARRWEYLL